MASRADLFRAGTEGFALVDEYIDKQGRLAARGRPAVRQVYSQGCLYQHHPYNQTVVHQVKPISAAEEKMISYEVVQFRNGVSIMEYSKRKSRAVGY